jgi:DNA polymerase phi
MNTEALDILLDLISSKESDDNNLIADFDDPAISQAMDADDDEQEVGSSSDSDEVDEDEDEEDEDDEEAEHVPASSSALAGEDLLGAADVVLGDEEMFALDEKLSETFRALRKERQAQAGRSRA